jgi:putative transposase
MSRMLSPSSGKPYGLAQVCRIWRMARANVYWYRHPARPVARSRPGPHGMPLWSMPIGSSA